MKLDAKYYLEMMCEYANRAVKYIADISKEEFQDNEEKQDAVSHVLYRFAEASVQIEDTFKAKYDEIGWKDIHGFRVLLAHQYHRVEMTILYNIVIEELPLILELLMSVLTKLQAEEKEK